MFTPRTTLQGHGRNKEIVVLHIEQSDEYRGMFPKSSNEHVHNPANGLMNIRHIRNCGMTQDWEHSQML